MIYRMVAGFVGLHMLEDLGLLSMGYFLGAHLPAWIFFPRGYPRLDGVVHPLRKEGYEDLAASSIKMSATCLGSFPALY